MNISINNELCFVCGLKEPEDAHHTIPKCLKPINNITVRICKDCHSKINSIDMGSVANYVHSLMLSSNKISNSCRAIKDKIKKLED